MRPLYPVAKLLSLFLLIGLVTPVFGLPRFEEISTSWATTPLPLPKQQRYEGEILSADGSESTPFVLSVTLAENGFLRTEVMNKKTQTVLLSSPAMVLKSGSFSVNDAPLIDRLDYDFRTAKMDEEGIVTLRFLRDDAMTKEKRLYYSPNTMDTSTILPALQRVLYSDGGDFDADFVVQGLGFKTGVHFRQVRTNDLRKVAPQYELPPQIESIADLSEPVVAYELSVAGFFSLFYPHKHYYIYQSKPPYAFVGAWGGPEKDLLFSIIPGNLPR